MPARVGSCGIPEHLGIHMGVSVDESGGDDMALGVDLPASTRLDTADCGDSVTGDRHVGAVGAEAGAVDDGAVADDEIVSDAPIFAYRIAFLGRSLWLR